MPERLRIVFRKSAAQSWPMPLATRRTGLPVMVPTFQHGELHGGRARALEHSTRTKRPLTATGSISTAKPRRIRDHSLSAHSLPKEHDSRYRWTRKDISLGYIRQSDDFRRVDICLKSGPARKISVGPPGDWPRTSFGPEKLNE